MDPACRTPLSMGWADPELTLAEEFLKSCLIRTQTSFLEIVGTSLAAQIETWRGQLSGKRLLAKNFTYQELNLFKSRVS